MTGDLTALVNEFHKELAASIRAFTGNTPALTINEGGPYLEIKNKGTEDNPALIPLKADEEIILGLQIKVQCVLDSLNKFLAVENSTYAFYPLGKARGEPLFPVEYVRHQSKDLPTAHLHVHAHRDQFTHLLGHAGDRSSRAKERGKRPVTKTVFLSEYHFPMGGPRFRPTLEDVLESVRVEFGLDVTSRWRDRLHATREKWRETQTAAAVRDCPRAAVRVLRDQYGLPIPNDWVLPDRKLDNLHRS